jgi:hypothetical protein
LTVLFCDLVGSTEIAARLDPEEWREVVAGYHRAAAEAISRFGGHVAKYLGDGVMAYFGWPEAHDNDGERAARAGLAILETVLKLSDDPTSPKLTARVGIDSGAVVVGAGASKDADVFGETPEYRSAAAGDCRARHGTDNSSYASLDIGPVRSRSTWAARDQGNYDSSRSFPGGASDWGPWAASDSAWTHAICRARGGVAALAKPLGANA